MQTEIIVTIIASITTIVTIMIQNSKHNESISELIEYRMRLSEEKNARNSEILEQTVQRVYALEQTTTVLDERQKTANHRINDLEKKGA